VLYSSFNALETEEMMEMDSPGFFASHGAFASIDGESSKIRKEGQSETLTCRLYGIINQKNKQKSIEWIKNGVPLSLTVKTIIN
jgi:hypothetical protein